MSMPTDYANADTAWVCARKKAYPDEKLTKKVARRMNEEKQAGVVAYACTRCGRYHIGRAPAQ